MQIQAYLQSSKVVVFIVILFNIQAMLGQLVQKYETPLVEPPAYQEGRWDPKLFQILSFGQLPLALDWFVMKSLFDPGLGRVTLGVHPPLYYNFDLVTELDPAFSEVYEIGANLLAIVRKDGEGARDLLTKGRVFVEEKLPHYPPGFKEKFWDHSWNIYVLLAYVNLFVLEDMPKAAEAFRKAAVVPGAPAYLVRLEKRLDKPGGEYEVGLSLLEFMISGQKEEVLLEQLKRKKANLTIGKFIFEMNSEFHGFLKSKKLKLPLPPNRSLLEKYFQQFLTHSKFPPRDPWGGLFKLNENGSISTTTPYEVVFGLK